jgi:hypothetical protein
VNEDILATRFRGNEAVAFCWIEPLNGATGHRRAAFLATGRDENVFLERPM